jgi:hypothetical protein
MRDEAASGSQRLAAWILRRVAKLWPEETLPWGLALERELFVVKGPRASLRWAWGGVRLLTQAWWNHFLRSWNRPIGVPGEGPLAELAKNARRVPRTPRWVTALLLLASLTVVMIPDVREAMRASLAAWSHRWGVMPDSRTLARLRKASSDPQAMALMALLSEDSVERVRMADEAVRLDPSLTWIYSQVRTTAGQNCCRYELPAEWIEKLKKWDPDNAVPRLLAAQQRFIRFEDEWAQRGYRGEYDREAKHYLANDAKWMAVMQFAFQAPKYESYDSKRFELYRTVAERYDFRDLGMVHEILSRQFPAWTHNAWIYGELLLDRGEAAERSGNDRQAIELYSQPAQSGERMAEQSHTDFERSAWIGIERSSLRRLAALLAKSGRAEEATLASYKLAAFETSLLPSVRVKFWERSENGWEGFMIRFLTAGIFLLGAAALAGFSVLWARGCEALESRGLGLALASLAVDYCPVLLLMAGCGLFVAYRPVVLMYEQYAKWPSPVYDFRGLVHALYTPYETPEGIQRLFYDFLNPYHYWMAAIVGLSIVVFYILLRRTLDRPAA